MSKEKAKDIIMEDKLASSIAHEEYIIEKSKSG